MIKLDRHHNNEVMLNLIRKSAILVFFVVLSTWIIFLVNIISFYFGQLLPIDCTINCACIYLSFKCTQDMYDKLCSSCDLFVSRVCMCGCQRVHKSRTFSLPSFAFGYSVSNVKTNVRTTMSLVNNNSQQNVTNVVQENELE